MAAAESDSEHPLAAAIVAGARDRGLAVPAAAGFGSVTGKGVQATVAGHTVLVGNARLLAGAGIGTAALDAAAAELSAQGKTPVLAAVDGEPAGVLAVADTVKDDSAAAIAALRRLGVEVVMLTGDNARTAAAIARQAGMSRVLAEVLPEHKAAEIRRLQAEGRTVGMVGRRDQRRPRTGRRRRRPGHRHRHRRGDRGRRHHPHLRVAGRGGDRHPLSRATMRNIRQNLFFALAYNGIGIPIAAGILYPIAGIRLSPIIAAAAMALSSLSVVGNANRLRRYHPAPLPPADPAVTTEPQVETPAAKARPERRQRPGGRPGMRHDRGPRHRRRAPRHRRRAPCTSAPRAAPPPSTPIPASTPRRAATAPGAGVP